MQVEDVTDYEFQYFMRQITRVADAERLLVASFDDLEPRVIEALSKQLRVQAVGPVILHRKEEEEAPTGLLPNTTDDPLQQWLDKQELNSVIYIAFGSLANLTLQEVHAIAYGLVQSKQPFIWALREGTVPNIDDPLPHDFRQSTEAQGLVVKWAQQRQILKHPAIAAFLTHCGWGSTLESICMGVPLVCWPLYGDQLLNCNLLVDQWQAGIRLAPSLPNRRKSLTPEHVESAIVTIINSPAYRSNMIKLQTLAKKACDANGKSANNLRDLVHDLHALAKTVHPQG
jgi:UDP:flavonoid glycosyltransferase YjiC (YdhE family)